METSIFFNNKFEKEIFLSLFFIHFHALECIICLSSGKIAAFEYVRILFALESPLVSLELAIESVHAMGDISAPDLVLYQISHLVSGYEVHSFGERAFHLVLVDGKIVRITAGDGYRIFLQHIVLRSRSVSSHQSVDYPDMLIHELLLIFV